VKLWKGWTECCLEEILNIVLMMIIPAKQIILDELEEKFKSIQLNEPSFVEKIYRHSNGWQQEI
jgi:hypothetical protein